MYPPALHRSSPSLHYAFHDSQVEELSSLQSTFFSPPPHKRLHPSIFDCFVRPLIRTKLGHLTALPNRVKMQPGGTTRYFVPWNVSRVCTMPL